MKKIYKVKTYRGPKSKTHRDVEIPVWSVLVAIVIVLLSLLTV